MAITGELHSRLFRIDWTFFPGRVNNIGLSNLFAFGRTNFTHPNISEANRVAMILQPDRKSRRMFAVRW